MKKRRPVAPLGSSRRPLPEGGTSDLRTLQLPAIAGARTEHLSKKIIEVLEGSRLLTPPPEPTVVIEPAVQLLERHPLAQDQAKYLQTNLRRFKKKNNKDAIDAKNDLFSRVIRDLPDAKQMVLLQTLSKISKSLEFGGLALNEDEGGVVSSPVKHAKGEPLSLRQDAGSNSSINSLASASASSYSHGTSASESMAQLSLAGSYASSKSYGKAKPDVNHSDAIAVLNRIGHGMHLNPAQEQNYDLSGRGVVERVPPTSLIARLHAEFKVHISTSEIATLMKKFDIDKRGVVDIVDVLGSAKNVYSKTIYDDNMEEIQRETEVQKKLLVEKRAEFKAKLGGKEVDGTEIEGTLKKDTMKSIIEKLSMAAYDAIRLKALKPLNSCRLKLSPFEFKNLLVTLDCKLCARESFLLERRYFQGQTGTIDAAMFRSEFIALGKDMIRDSRRADAMQSFIKALSRGTGANGNQVDMPAGFASLDANPGKPERIPAGDSIIRKSQMTMEMAEEWISDPLMKRSDGFRRESEKSIATPALSEAAHSGESIRIKPPRDDKRIIRTPALEAPIPISELSRPSSSELFEENNSGISLPYFLESCPIEGEDRLTTRPKSVSFK